MELSRYFEGYEGDIKENVNSYVSEIRNFFKTNNYEEILKRKQLKVILASIEILKEDIASFDYDSTEGYDYLSTLLFFLKGFLGQLQDHSRKELVNDFVYIYNELAAVLRAKPSYLTETNQTNYEKLKTIMVELEREMANLFGIKRFDPTTSKFIDYITFDIKNLNVFNYILEKYPYLVNSLDINNIPLIERVLNRYISELLRYVYHPNLGPIDDLIYFEKVYKTIIASDKIKLDDSTRKVLLTTLLDTQKKYKFDSNVQKEKFNYFIYNAIFATKGQFVEETLDDLNYKYEIHDKFSSSINLESKYIISKFKKMQDAPTVDRFILTFDGKDAKEIDDALSISEEDGIYKLGVHIADPMHFLDRSSSLYLEASRRTRSLYMGNSCIPMYPSEISRGIAGLNEGVTTFALNYFFDIDKETGSLIKMDINNKPIKVNHNMTYSEFDHILKHGTDDKQIEDTIRLLNEVNKYTGAIYDMSDIYKVFHHDNFQGSGETTIANAMIYTNYNISNWFYKNNLPFIYRCHAEDENKIATLESLKTALEELHRDSNGLINIINKLSNIYPKAYYSTKNTGHEGLHLESYSHCTSPLRRMPDGENSMAIKKFYISNKYTDDDIRRYTEYLEKCASESNSKRSTLDDYEANSNELVRKYKRSQI